MVTSAPHEVRLASKLEGEARLLWSVSRVVMCVASVCGSHSSGTEVFE